MASRTLSHLEETASLVEELGVEALVVPTDVSDQEQVEELVKKTLERFSTVDILVNNAAIIGPIGLLWEDDPTDWIQTVQVNLFGTFLCIRSVLPVMIQNDSGKIINVTSCSSAFMGDTPYKPASKYRHFTAYTSSKAGQIQITEYLVYQLAGKNIQVNAMQPAGQTKGLREIRNRMDELGQSDFVARVDSISGKAKEISDRSAELAVFLASDASNELSGRLLWYGEDFRNLPIKAIMASDAYTLRRIELDA